MLLESFFVSFFPIFFFLIGSLLVVLRAGASRIFFDVVGTFQATRLIDDATTRVTVMQGLMLDGMSGIFESANLVSDQMQMIADRTVEVSQRVEEARLEFEKFASFKGAEEIQQQIIAMGESYAFTADEALNAGSRMAQLGGIIGGGAPVAAATQMGIQFGLVGGMDTERAMKDIISLQQQTGFMYGELTKAQYNRLTAQEKANIVGVETTKMMTQLNTIENRSAATLPQLTHVMNQFASSARLAGDDVSYMAAMSATLIEAGEEQGKAGRALKMMYARLGADTGNNAEILRQYGVEVKDADGNLRSMEDIMNDITRSKIMDSEATKLQVAQAIAGNDHYVRAIKLMEQHSRTVQLNKQAQAGLDDVNEEINRKLKDQSYLLRLAETRYENASAALGKLYTPAVTMAKNAQAGMIEGLVGMAEQSEVFAFGLDKLFKGQQMYETFRPFFEAKLNLLSMNISLQTQLAVLRAVNGQELIRRSAYGGQVAAMNAGLTSLQQQLMYQDSLISKQIMGVKARREESLLLALNAGKLKNMEQSEINAIQQKIGVLRYEIALEKQKIADKEKERALNMQTNLTLKSNLTEAIKIKQQRIDELNTQKNLTNEQKYQLLVQQGVYQNTYRTDAQMKRILEGQALQNNFKKIEAGYINQINSALEYQTTELAFLNTQYADTEAKLRRINTESMNRLQNQMMGLKGLMAQELQLILTQEMGNDFSQKAYVQENQAKQILRLANNNLADAITEKTTVQMAENIIMQQVEVTARELATAYGVDAAMLRQILPQMEVFNHHLVKTKANQDALAASQMRMNNLLMVSSGVLGSLSMVYSLLGDSEKNQRAAMIFMTASMIPATIQMFTMTKATMSAATGMMGYTAATNTATVATSRFNKVVKMSVVGLALGAFVYAVDKFAASMGNAKDEMEDFRQSYESIHSSLTQQDFTSVMESQGFAAFDDGRTFAQRIQDIDGLAYAYDNLAYSQRQINNLLKEMQTTESAALLERQKETLATYQKQEAVLQDIVNLKAAEKLLSDEMEAEMYFGDIQSIADLYEKQADLEDAGLLAKTGDTFKKIGNMVGMENETIAQQLHDNQRQIDHMLSVLPSEYKDAIQDLANQSKDFEDFMTKLADFVENERERIEGVGDSAGGMLDGFISPIEAAKEAMFEFSNAREEMFFGMSKGNITGDMVKQVVNKGVETLINTTEVIMTNNFNGMTTGEAATEITNQVVKNLNDRGLNVQL